MHLFMSLGTAFVGRERSSKTDLSIFFGLIAAAVVVAAAAAATVAVVIGCSTRKDALWRSACPLTSRCPMEFELSALDGTFRL